MAANIFTGATNSNWGTSTNWSQGAVPTASDGFVTTFNNTSPNCTVNTSSRVCNGIDFTGYTNTITMTFQISVSGNITLASSMGISGSGQLIMVTSGTVTSNGKTWPNAFFLTATTMTVTLADALNITGLFTISNSGTYTFSGAFNITCGTASIGGTSTLSGNITVSGSVAFASSAGTINGASFNLYIGGSISFNTGLVTMSGTAGIIFNGTSTWPSTATSNTIKNNLTINTSGTITFAGTFAYNTGTFTYTAGTVVTTGSTLNAALSTTFNTNGITWNNVTFAGTSQTFTLSSNLNLSGLFTCNGSTTTTINGAFTITTSGGYTQTTVAIVSGTTSLKLTGGTWTSTTSAVALRLDTEIAGNITLGTNVVYNVGTLTYTSGTVTTTGSTLFINNGTYNTNGIIWNNVSAVAGATVTLLSDMSLSGTLVNTGTGTITINGFTMNMGGLAPLSSGTFSGTTNFIFNGTGTWSGAGLIKNNITINTAGTLTISGSVTYNTGTFTYVAGTVITSGSTLTASTNTTFNTAGMSFANITCGGVILLNSLLTLTGTLTISGITQFTGTGGFTVANFLMTTAGISHQLREGVTYTVTTDFTSTAGTAASHITLASSSGSVQAILTLNAGATQDLSFVNATRIDSSNGQTIKSYKGTLTTATNWVLLTAPVTVGFAYVA